MGGTTDSINLKYPVFASVFDDEGDLIVAGGGGEGNNGIKNKIVSRMNRLVHLRKSP